MKRLRAGVDILATILIIVAAGLVIWRQFVPIGSSRPPAIEDAAGVLPPELLANRRGDGPVAVIEFADFQCPFCGQHARETQPAIRKAFVDAGVVREVFVNYPLPNHPRAQPASEAAICAGNQGQFWEMHDGLFRNQSELEEQHLADRARELGLDLALFSKCLQSGDAQSVIERHKAVGRDLKVRATPSFFVGIVQVDGSVQLKKRINGALAFSDFSSAITELTRRELKPQIRSVAVRSPVLNDEAFR